MSKILEPDVVYRSDVEANLDRLRRGLYGKLIEDQGPWRGFYRPSDEDEPTCGTYSWSPNRGSALAAWVQNCDDPEGHDSL